MRFSAFRVFCSSGWCFGFSSATNDRAAVQQASLVYGAREIHENGRGARLAALESAMMADQTVLELPVQGWHDR
jgi:hypothetical protein